MIEVFDGFFGGNFLRMGSNPRTIFINKLGDNKFRGKAGTGNDKGVR